MKKMVLLFPALFAVNAFAVDIETDTKITFPYSQYKEVEFANPTLTKHFETFITEMQKSDLAFSKEYLKVEEEYRKKHTKAQRRAAYKKEQERKEIVDKVIIENEKAYNGLMGGYLKDQVGLFNNFVKTVQNSKHMTKEESINFLKAIKPVHTSYIDAHSSLKYRIGTYNQFCFDKEYEGFLPDWCYLMYTESITDVRDFKYTINTKMNKFITAYKVGTTKKSFRKELQMRIEEINRYESFKWE